MCARYSLFATAEELVEWFRLRKGLPLAPRYNIAPTQPVLIVRSPKPGERSADLVRWGLVPHWAKDTKIGNRLINARSETAAEKPSFRNAFRRRRCLIPSSGFYEWQPAKSGKGPKQPFLIRPTDGPLFAFAGLWEHWHAPDGGELETCTILTTDANATIAPIHDRMPVILLPEDYDRWLDPEQQDAKALAPLLRPLPDDAVEAVPVSTHVNNPRNEDAGCIEPVGASGE